MGDAKSLSKAYYENAGLALGAKALAKAAKVSEYQARRFLARQELAQLHKKPPKQAAQASIDVRKPNRVHQADLLFLPHDRDAKYALVVVDAATRKLDAEPLPNKKAVTVRDGFQRIYARHPGAPLGKPPQKIAVDDGTEFKGAVAKYFADHKTFLVRGEPGHHRSQALAESANKQIGTALLKRMTAQELLTGEKSTEWTEDLPAVVAALNKLRKPRKPPPDKILSDGKSILPIGSRVRVALEHPTNPVTGQVLTGPFRAADPRWDTTIRKVAEVMLIPGRPPMYRIEGKRHMYTRNRLYPVTKAEPPPPSVIRGSPSTYIVEELLKRRKQGNRVQFLVLWRGFPKDQATWETRSSLMADVPDMVRAYERAL